MTRRPPEGGDDDALPAGGGGGAAPAGAGNSIRAKWSIVEGAEANLGADVRIEYPVQRRRSFGLLTLAGGERGREGGTRVGGWRE